MRRIISRKDELKKKKRNQWILGVVLVIVMFGSVFGIVANSFGKKDSDEVKYNGYSFVPQSGYWSLNLGDFNFFFKNNPLETQNLSLEDSEIEIISHYQSKPLYLYSEDYSASNEIYQNIGPFVERIQQACLTEENCTGDLPIKSCEDNFIQISISEENKLFQDKNCVFIEGKEEDLLKVTDEFLFKVLGIKQ
ncbi:hypothetical protein HOD29_03625 [archaeon]|jgi:hypothetical protein|nr:hypothetical protein [archaeon]